MKKFVWRLQRVLDIKKKEEQKKRTELFAVTEKLAGTRSELLMQKRKMENLISEIIAEKDRERLSKQELFLKCSVTDNKRIKELQQKEQKLESEQRKKIAEVIKVKRFKEGLEKLCEEAKMQFIKEQEKIEQKELDEHATIGFVRNKSSNKTKTFASKQESEL